MTPFFQPLAFSNPETALWIARVMAAGSSVSRRSAQAHDTFISAAKAGGFWSLISRLNTYGANTLAGAMVPLVNTVGTTVDANHNFVSGDFSLGAGLTGDGATKYLDTGAYLGSSSKHIMGCLADASIANSPVAIGASTTLSSDFIYAAAVQPGVELGSSGLQVSILGTLGSGFLIGTVIGANQVLYRNNTSIVSTAFTGASSPTNIFVHCMNNIPSGGAGNFCSATIQAYSLGLNLTTAEMTAYYTAMQTLMTALGRTIPA